MGRVKGLEMRRNRGGRGTGRTAPDARIVRIERGRPGSSFAVRLRLGAGLRWLARLVGEVYTSWQRHRCTQLGAAIAFYGIFSLVPLLLLLTSAFGFLLASWAGPDIRVGLARLLEDRGAPQIARTVLEALAATEEARGSLGLIGFGALLFAGMGAFGQLENAVQVVFDVHASDRRVPFRQQVRSFLRGRFASFLLMVGAAALVVLSTVSRVLFDTMARERLEEFGLTGTLAEPRLGFLASGCIVVLLFRWLPARAVPWRAALAGGWITAVLWELAKVGLSSYLTRNDYARAYPLIGSALAILVWVYVAGLVFLLGAQVAASITRMLDGRAVPAGGKTGVAGPINDREPAAGPR